MHRHKSTRPLVSAADLAQAPAEPGGTGGKPYFVFVGSLHPRKNISGLLQAFGAYRAMGGKQANWSL